MKNYWKRLLVIFTVLILLMGNSITTFAAPQTMADGAIFDAELYADTYPDLKEAYGYNAEMLYQHFLLFGMNEGRTATYKAPPIDLRNYKQVSGYNVTTYIPLQCAVTKGPERIQGVIRDSVDIEFETIRYDDADMISGCFCVEYGLKPINTEEDMWNLVMDCQKYDGYTNWDNGIFELGSTDDCIYVMDGSRGNLETGSNKYVNIQAHHGGKRVWIFCQFGSKYSLEEAKSIVKTMCFSTDF